MFGLKKPKLETEDVHPTKVPILEAVDLQKTYGRRRVVDGVSLHVGEAEIVGLLGPNGAGKSTSFRMICGMIEPERGRVYLEGRDVTQWPMFKRARDGHMGYLPQDSSVFKKLTVEQNISSLLELLGFSRAARKERTHELLEEFNITHIRKSKAAGLSGGEQRRLEIARCLVSNPRIVMLDEPFAGVDPVTVQSIQDVIIQLRESGISILITDHAAREILGTVDRCYVIYKGQVLIDGTPDEVRQHPKVQQEYLGKLDEIDKNHNGGPTQSSSAHGVPSPHFHRRSQAGGQPGRRQQSITDV